MVVVEGDIDSLNSTLAALQVTPVQIVIENAAIESVLNASNSTSLQNMSAPSSPLSEQRKGTQPDASLPNGVDKFAAGDSIESDAVQRMELNRNAVPSAAEPSAVTQLRKTKNSVSPTSAAMQPSQPTNYKILLLITPTETGERQ